MDRLENEEKYFNHFVIPRRRRTADYSSLYYLRHHYDFFE